jgi:hypothetical protein
MVPFEYRYLVQDKGGNPPLTKEMEKGPVLICETVDAVVYPVLTCQQFSLRRLSKQRRFVPYCTILYGKARKKPFY